MVATLSRESVLTFLLCAVVVIFRCDARILPLASAFAAPCAAIFVAVEERPAEHGHCIAVRITAENPDQGFQVI